MGARPVAEEIEVTLTWSAPDGRGGHYMGSGGETTTTMTRTALWKLITEGQRDPDTGEEVTSICIFTATKGAP